MPFAIPPLCKGIIFPLKCMIIPNGGRSGSGEKSGNTTGGGSTTGNLVGNTLRATA